MVDAWGAKRCLAMSEPGAWVISPLTNRIWARWPGGEIDWLPPSVLLPSAAKVVPIHAIEGHAPSIWNARRTCPKTMVCMGHRPRDRQSDLYPLSGSGPERSQPHQARSTQQYKMRLAEA
jgi:hypothetical protein